MKTYTALEHEEKIRGGDGYFRGLFWVEMPIQRIGSRFTFGDNDQLLRPATGTAERSGEEGDVAS